MAGILDGGGVLDMIGKVLGNLRIVKKIGEGGMGAVYLAEHSALKKRFAVKCLTARLTEDAGFRERFYREAVNHALLDHQNIVQATDFFDQDGEFFLVMEYVGGQGLNDLIKQSGKLSEEEALRIFKDILRGLNFAHSKGVIHRDIKPSNVIVDESGRARITDFGIAILVGEKRLTSAGANVGSSWYMSPEQILHPANIDHRSDVYSAGIVLYEMLTGDVPFDGESEFTVQNKQVRDPVPDPAGRNTRVSSELKKIMLKALEKDPEKRFSGCGEFLATLEAYEKAKSYGGPVLPRWLPFVSVLALGVIGALAYWLGFSDSDGRIPGAGIQNNAEEPVYDRIKEATETASFLCREMAILKNLEAEARIAIDSDRNDTAAINRFNQQIKDRENNIKDYFAKYTEAAGKLAKAEKEAVDRGMSKYNGELAKKELFRRIQITRLVAQHYLDGISDASNPLTIEKLGEQCPVQQGG